MIIVEPKINKEKREKIIEQERVFVEECWKHKKRMRWIKKLLYKYRHIFRLSNMGDGL